MSAESVGPLADVESVSENEIRDYAYHIYVESGHRNDRCRENWVDARACLKARVPMTESGAWLRDNSDKKKK